MAASKNALYCSPVVSTFSIYQRNTSRVVLNHIRSVPLKRLIVCYAQDDKLTQPTHLKMQRNFDRMLESILASTLILRLMENNESGAFKPTTCLAFRLP